MIHFLAEAPDTPDSKACFGQLQMVRGSPFPAALQQKWKDRFGIKRAGSNAYGLTEAARVTTLRYDQEAPPGSSGRVNEDFDVRIVDDHDIELPAGQAGEVVIRPRRPHVMFEGYWDRPQDTLAVMRNLWLHTGDIGRFDAQGFFYFVDRKKDYLRRRGENISTHEVEVSLRVHPAQGRRHRDRGGDLPLGHRAAAVLRGAALLRVPRGPAPQPRGSGAKVPTARRGLHAPHMGPRARRRRSAEALSSRGPASRDAHFHRIRPCPRSPSSNPAARSTWSTRLRAAR
jgi:hypothetical protein